MTEYWSDFAAFADGHDVDIAIEMRPNTMVFGPVGIVKLREQSHERVAANLNPFHLW